MVVGCFQICCGINDGHGDNNGQRRKGKIKIKNAFEFAYDDQYYNNKDDGRAGGLRLSRNTTTGTSTTASVATAGSWPSTTEKASSALRLKRGNVHCHDRTSFFSSLVDVDEARTYKCHCYPKSDEERHFIITNYQKHELFYDLTPNELDELVSATQKLEFTKQGQVVTQQDDTGEGLYLVQTGRLAYYDDGDGDESDDNNRQQVVLESGDLYGELDLMLGQQRAAKTLTVTSPDGRAVVWKLNHRVFRCLLAKHSLNQGSNILSALRNVKLFLPLADQTLAKFADALVRVTFIKGDRIVTKGEIGDAFYIIEEGQVKVHDIGIGDSQPADIILGPGDSFGERSLLTGGPRAANVTALSSKVTTFAMDRQTFEDNIGQLEDLLNFPTKLQAIKGLPIFTDTDITDVEYERIAELTVEVCYKEGSKLFENGRPYPPCLWMIRSGQVIVYGKKSQHIYNFQTGDYLGDKSILNPDEHISSHDATCETNVDAWVLKRDDIQSVIVDLNRLGKTAGYLNIKRESLVKIGLDDLKRHKILGQGGFGKVWLVQSKSTRDVYALKIINKRKLLESKHERSVLREKEMLELLHHPFILHLVSSFQDETNLYLVLPVIQGGELFSVVSQKPNGLSAHDAAFYGTCIIEALGHFHHRYIAYRDLVRTNTSERCSSVLCA
jgi:CRP-like cAMP-binding protein